nr:hypothetical protein [Providencia rettgeri]
MKPPKIDPFKLLASQGLVTSHSVALSIYGLNPYITNKDIPEDLFEDISILRTAIVSNVRTIYRNVRVNTEVESDIVFGSAYQYMTKEITPEIISSRIYSAIENTYKEHKKDNEWKKYLKAFGGQSLVDEWGLQNKKGQGQYRKNDEQKGTYKLIGLLILLLQEKNRNGRSSSNDYGTINNTNKQKIYDDIEKLAREINENFLIGVKRSTFYDKVRDAEYYLNESIIDITDTTNWYKYTLLR